MTRYENYIKHSDCSQSLLQHGVQRLYCNGHHSQSQGMLHPISEDAIEALKSNARNVIEHVRKDCKPEDLVGEDVMRSLTLEEEKEIYRLKREISQMTDQMTDLQDREDEMAVIHMESLADGLERARAKLKDLETPKPSGKKESKFEARVRRMTEILNMDITAQELSTARCYPVAYFDDSRSILNYVP